MKCSVPILGVFLLCLTTTLPAQAPEYEPDYQMSSGRELVGVFIGSYDCGGGRAEGLKEAIEELKLILAERALEVGVNFRMIGVTVDWEVAASLDYLAEFGAFDELIVGSNWFNVGAQRFLWADSTKKTVVPQVQVIEHEVRPSERWIDFGPPRTLIQILGSEEIIRWVGEAAPVPSSAEASQPASGADATD